MCDALRYRNRPTLLDFDFSEAWENVVPATTGAHVVAPSE